MNASKISRGKAIRFASPVLVAAAVGGIVWVSAGDLNPPPGPISPTMKTLDQIEPRTAIVPTAEGGTVSAQGQTLLVTCPTVTPINNPGSYYLGDNCTGVSGSHGIVIDADNVTLDLNGFALIGMGGTGGDGISVASGVRNLAVRNGTIRGWGGAGVNATFATTQFENLRADDNGSTGLHAGSGSTVTNCTAQFNGGNGIDASGSTVTNCTAQSNGGNGIDAFDSTVTNCTAQSNGGNGIDAFDSTVTNCTARSNSGDGISSESGSTVTNCTSTSNAGDGIRVNGDSHVVGNTCIGNGLNDSGGAGIHVGGGTTEGRGGPNRIEGNHVTLNKRGLSIRTKGNYIADNTVQINTFEGTTDNYDIAAGNNLNILLCQIPESIDWPAMVTLAGSLTGIANQNGITVNADNVTIDLGGHALIGVPDSRDGIALPFVDKGVAFTLVVRNGTLRKWGDNGVDALFSIASQFENLRALDNGNVGIRVGLGSTVTNCIAHSNIGKGIVVGDGSMITNCTASTNGVAGISTSDSTITNCTARFNNGNGIVVINSGTVTNCTSTSNNGNGIDADTSSTVTDCTVTFNTGQGISAGNGSTVTNCTARGNGNTGIFTDAGSTVTNCTAWNNLGSGIVAGGNGTVRNCTAAFNNGNGIEVSNDCRVVGNTCDGNGNRAGIHTSGSGNRIEGNHVTDNNFGIDVQGSRNIIIKNTASGNTSNYNIVANNAVGSLVFSSWPLIVSGSTHNTNSSHTYINFSH